MATPAQSNPKYSKAELLTKLRAGPETWNDWWNTLAYEERKAIYFSDADLQGLDLNGALFRHADFGESNLFETGLRDSDLRAADLSKVTSCLSSKQFAGADLTGAKLPEALTKLYEKLETVSQISDSAKKLFLALLAACLYSWLTIGTTKDVDLITNRASSPLPIIQTAIPIVGFYVVAPIILLCVYFYFHFYLQKLWEELAQLPAIFPDGKPLHQRADPWLFNDLVRAHFSRLRENRPFLSYLQQWISILLAWWLVPITLLLLWGRFLPRHDMVWTIVLTLLLSTSIVSAFQLYRLAKETLQGQDRNALGGEQFLKRPRTYADTAISLMIFGALLTTSVRTISGRPLRSDPIVYVNEKPKTRATATWAPVAMSWFGYIPFANLENADVSVKPPDWNNKKDEDLDRVKGAILNSKNLRYIYANSAFLVKAQLEDSDLEGALLQVADLRAARLTDARLQDADLSGANLAGADLKFTNLEGADLSGTDLTGANLRDANLKDVRTGITLSLEQSGDLQARMTELRYAHLDGVEPLSINIEDLKQCQHWQMAFYDDDVLNRLGLPQDHNEALQEYRDSGSQEPFGSWQTKWRAEKAKAARTKPK